MENSSTLAYFNTDHYFSCFENLVKLMVSGNVRIGLCIYEGDDSELILCSSLITWMSIFGPCVYS